MVSYYDELEIEDFVWDEEAKVYHYPCPCGDRFEISKAQLRDGEEIATCPSCSLIVRVIYDYVRAHTFATLTVSSWTMKTTKLRTRRTQRLKATLPRTPLLLPRPLPPTSPSQTSLVPIRRTPPPTSLRKLLSALIYWIRRAEAEHEALCLVLFSVPHDDHQARSDCARLSLLPPTLSPRHIALHC